MDRSKRLIGLRALWALTGLLFASAAWQTGQRAAEAGILFLSRRWTLVWGFWVLCAMASGLLLLLTWTSRWPQLVRGIETALGKSGRLRVLFLPLFFLSAAFFPFLVPQRAGEFIYSLILRLGLFWLTALIAAFFLKAYCPARSWRWTLLTSFVLNGVGYRIALFLPDISTYPFSLTWSEASRYYYASLFFAERIYGVSAPPPVLHPSRYLMQAIPFLIPGLPLWFHRLWQVLLWLTLPVLTAWLLARRLKVGRKAFLPFLAWAFLFLFQGPVYYHLLVCVATILWGLGASGGSKFWRSLGVVALASAWAGISRINWFPVPGLLAACLYWLETPLAREDAAGIRRWRAWGFYMLKPALWFGLGTLIAFGSQALYIEWSGIGAQNFATSFTSDLLWNRLWPNSTYPLGILPGIAIVSLPLLIFTWIGLRRLSPLRSFGLGMALLVLFAGGVVVSLKIGGGSNLHNLDAFLTLLWIVGSSAFFRQIEADTPARGLSPVENKSGNLLSLGLVALAVFVPVVMTFREGEPLPSPEAERVERSLAYLDEWVHQAVTQGGEVLFISQRHLITFGILPDVPLVSDYENVTLMEMAMADNRDYLDRFYADIRNHRFALIVSDPQRGVGYRSDEYSSLFAEEHLAWVRRISKPLLAEYQSKHKFKAIGIEVYEPKNAYISPLP